MVLQFKFKKDDTLNVHFQRWICTQTLSLNFCDLIEKVVFKQQLIENWIGSNRPSVTITFEKIGVTTQGDKLQITFIKVDQAPLSQNLVRHQLNYVVKLP